MLHFHLLFMQISPVVLKLFYYTKYFLSFNFLRMCKTSQKMYDIFCFDKYVQSVMFEIHSKACRYSYKVLVIFSSFREGWNYQTTFGGNFVRYILKLYQSWYHSTQTYRHNMHIEHSVLLFKEHLKILYFLTCKGITCNVFLHF